MADRPTDRQIALPLDGPLLLPRERQVHVTMFDKFGGVGWRDMPSAAVINILERDVLFLRSGARTS